MTSGLARDGSRRGRGVAWSKEKFDALKAMMASPDFDTKTAARALGETVDRVRDKIKGLKRRRRRNVSDERASAELAAGAEPWHVYEAPLADYLPGRARQIENTWSALMAGARFT